MDTNRKQQNLRISKKKKLLDSKKSYALFKLLCFVYKIIAGSIFCFIGGKIKITKATL